MASGGRGSGHQSSEDQGIDPCQFARGSYRRSTPFYSLQEKKFFFVMGLDEFVHFSRAEMTSFVVSPPQSLSESIFIRKR